MALPSQNPALVKASGGDYTSLIPWEADLDDSPLDNDYAAEIEGEITGSVNFFGVDGSGRSPAYEVIIREKSGFEADGTNESTCAKNVGTIGLLGSVAIIYDVSGIEVSDGIYGFQCANDNAEGFTLTKNVMRDTTTNSGIEILSPNVNVGCNLLIDCGSGAFDGGIRINDAAATSSNVIILNNTIYHSSPANSVVGYYEVSGESLFKNNAICYYDNNNSADDWLSIAGGSVTYCAGSGDSNLPSGTGNINTIRDDGTDWTNTSISDFSLVSDGVLVGAGQTISGESWFPSTDLVGTTWASPPAIGCFEVVSGGGLTKDLADTITMSDSISLTINKSLSDSVSLSDSIIKNIGLNKADSLSLSDNLSNLIGLNKSDTITMSDNFNAIITLILALADTISMSDSLDSKDIGLVKSDTISMSDSLSNVFGLNKSDTITLSEIISKLVGISQSDTITMSDNFNALITLILSLNDTITMSDSITSKDIGLSKSDTIILSDNISTVSEFIRSIADNVTMSDNIAKEIGISEADTITMSDNFSSSMAAIYALIDFLAKKRNFNFNAKNKTFNFNAKSRGT